MMRSILISLLVPATLIGLGGCPPEAPPDDVGPLDVTAATTATDAADKGATVGLTARLVQEVPAGSVTYEWFQTYGRMVEIVGRDTADANFVAPSIGTGQTLRFRVDVRGTDGTIYSDTVEVVVAADPEYAGGTGGDGGTPTPMERLRAELAKSAGQRKAEFDALIDDNVDAEGNRLTSTASGLKYVAIVTGDGERPGESDRVRVQYAGWLRDDGTQFDSSVDRGQPSEFNLDGVIDGWTEGLQLMPTGSYYRMVIPPDLGYGSSGNSNIPGDATLVFDVYLIAIVDE